MKKIIALLTAILIINFSYSQTIPVRERSGVNVVVVDQRSGAVKNFNIPVYEDTLQANLSVNIGNDSCGALIFNRETNSPWYRQCSPKMWVPFGSGGSFSAGDTIFVNLPLYITNLSARTKLLQILHDDGLVSGGYVSWSGTGLKFYVSPAVFYLGGKIYQTLLDSVTLDPADPTNPRFDLIGLDTTLHAFKLTGTPSPTPLVPQDTSLYQLPLTSGISVLPLGTTPGNVTFNTIYDENIEWANGTQGTITANFDDVSNPFTGTKDIFISSYNYGAGVYFQDSNRDSLRQGDVLIFHLYSNGLFNNPLFLFFYDPTTGGQTNIYYVNSNNGLNVNDSNNYQTITVPLSALNWNGNTHYQTLLMRMAGYDTSGAKGFFLDKIQIQSGNINLPPQSDWTTSIINQNLYQNINGANTLIGPVGGGGGGSTDTTSLSNRINRKWDLSGNTTVATDFIGTNNNSSFRIHTNGTEKMVVDSNGMVGIGKALPVTTLDILSNGSTGIIQHKNLSSVGYEGMNLLDNNDSLSASFIHSNSGVTTFPLSTWMAARVYGQSLKLVVNDSLPAVPTTTQYLHSKLDITSPNGYVGINNQSPTEQLHVKGRVRIDSIATGGGSDSVIVVNGGVLKKVLQSSISGGGGTVTAVTGSGNIASSGGTTPNITFTGVLPIANGGTNNGSLAVTAGSIYYGDGTKLIALDPGTSSQLLHSGTTPSWKDTTVISFRDTLTPVWNRMGVVMNATQSSEGNNTYEPSVIYEGSPQILTTATKVFKMWYTTGWGIFTRQINYAESLDGITWSKYASNPIITSHSRGFVIKNGSTYYDFCSNQSSTAIDVYTSANGMTSWTLGASNILGTNSWGTNFYNCTVIVDGSTWWLMVDGLNGSGSYAQGVYSSTTPLSGWSAPFTNPRITGLGAGSGFLKKIGSTYYEWVLESGSNTATLPSDLWRYSSPDMQTWTKNTPNSTFPRRQADEGPASAVGQVADVFLVARDSVVNMFYAGSQDGSDSSAKQQIKMATAYMPFSKLITTNEGDNGNVLESPPSTAWNVTGNSQADSISKFIGTTNVPAPLMFRVENTKRGMLSKTLSSIYFGSSPLGLVTAATQNTGVGWDALPVVTSGNGNSAYGGSALLALSTGQNNSSFGYLSSSFITTALGNVAMGYNAFHLGNGNYNTMVGYNTGASNTGTQNAALGSSALQASGAGNYNTALGSASLQANTSGAQNIAAGLNSGVNNTTASFQLFVNSIFRNNYAEDQNLSILYGVMNAAMTSQRLALNGKVGINNNSATAWLQLTPGSAAANLAPLKFSAPSVVTTAASGAANVATITFAAQNFIFPIGSTVTIAGVTPAGYNQTAVVSASTTTSVSYANITTGAQTVAGTVTAGTLLTTAEAGAVEYDGTSFYATPSSATRHTVDISLTGSATLDFASTAAQTSSVLTITVTGAADGDVVSLGIPNGSQNANSVFSAWVSAANTVSVKFNNYSSGAIDPASGTFKVRVIQ